MKYIVLGIGFRVTLYKDEGIGKDEGNNPTYVPDGYAHVPGTDMETGYVVQDGEGNQYVWIEVPRTTTVYPTAGTNITSFTNAEYEKIENDLHTYTSVYRNDSSWEVSDTYNANTDNGLTELEYNTQKKKMLKSIYKNQGFYIGRYETGIDYSQGARTALGNATQIPIIKRDAYPYNFVTCSQAQELSEGFATSGYTSSLMFGVQWDLVIKYLENKGIDQTELYEANTNWGNIWLTSWNATRTTTYYSKDRGLSYIKGLHSKIKGDTENKQEGKDVILLSTGASEQFSRQNIYDLYGNVSEFTLEYGNNGSVQDNVVRGANYGYMTFTKVKNRGYAAKGGNDGIGFRVALYTDE